MYKAAIRAMVRHGIDKMNHGNASFMMNMAHPDAELIFPGDNSWSTMFRPAQQGREAHVTHRGLEECQAFADRFVDEGLQYDIEDILVNGPPWNTRIAIRAVDSKPGSDGVDEYNNRFISFLEVAWGKTRRWEVYEDTQRSAEWDARRAAATSI